MHSRLTIASETIETPIGPLSVHACRKGIVAIDFVRSDFPRAAGEPLVRRFSRSRRELPRPPSLDERRAAQEHLRRATEQLEEYFVGTRSLFDLPLSIEGTEFEETVWRALLEIPHGGTRTYAEIARSVGRGPGAARAVGAAVGKNPLPIVVPCHRVVGTNGALTGFGGGLDSKRWLLEHESGQRRLDRP